MSAGHAMTFTTSRASPIGLLAGIILPRRQPPPSRCRVRYPRR